MQKFYKFVIFVFFIIQCADLNKFTVKAKILLQLTKAKKCCVDKQRLSKFRRYKTKDIISLIVCTKRIVSVYHENVVAVICSCTAMHRKRKALVAARSNIRKCSFDIETRNGKRNRFPMPAVHLSKGI